MDSYCVNKSKVLLCPINITKFEATMKIVNNAEASLLLGKIKFHLTNSTIYKNKKYWIARTREQLASWFQISTYKVDTLLKHLTQLNLIEYHSGLWYGQKRLFITISTEVNDLPINTTLFQKIQAKTNKVISTLIFSKIAFMYANTTIKNSGKAWCSIKKEDLANWAGVSIRTIHNIIEDLKNKGLIIKRKFSRNNKSQLHFHIPDFLYQAINTTQTTNIKICHLQKAKIKGSIKENIKEKETINNNKLKKGAKTFKSDISFNIRGTKLTNRQLDYLNKTFQRTIQIKNIKISSPNEVLEQVKYYLTNPQQAIGVASFQHALSRAMKIISDGNWLTPKGFHKYSEAGVKYYKKQKSAEGLRKSRRKLDDNRFKENMIIKNNDLNIINNKAKVLLDKIISISKSGNNEKATDFLYTQLSDLINKGADKHILKNHVTEKNLYSSV